MQAGMLFLALAGLDDIKVVGMSKPARRVNRWLLRY